MRMLNLHVVHLYLQATEILQAEERFSKQINSAQISLEVLKPVNFQNSLCRISDAPFPLGVHVLWLNLRVILSSKRGLFKNLYL